MAATHTSTVLRVLVQVGEGTPTEIATVEIPLLLTLQPGAFDGANDGVLVMVEGASLNERLASALQSAARKIAG